MAEKVFALSCGRPAWRSFRFSLLRRGSCVPSSMRWIYVSAIEFV